jgi:hypothetical protein
MQKGCVVFAISLSTMIALVCGIMPYLYTGIPVGKAPAVQNYGVIHESQERSSGPLPMVTALCYDFSKMYLLRWLMVLVIIVVIFGVTCSNLPTQRKFMLLSPIVVGAALLGFVLIFGVLLLYVMV